MRAGGRTDEERPHVDPDALLALTLARPESALAEARALLDSAPSDFDACVAHHAIGIVLRDRGDLPAAAAELRTAAQHALRSGSTEREVDVQATLGVTLAWMGRSERGLALLDDAVDRSRGAAAGRALMRRASVLRDLGRYSAANADLSRALTVFRRQGDVVWEARSLTHRAEVSLVLGHTARADGDYTRAEELFEQTGQDLEYAKARHNRGLVALAAGALPEALHYLDEAAQRYDVLGEVLPDLAIDRCATLLAAGLAEEALRETEEALARSPLEVGTSFRTSELLLAAATAALAAGEPALAADRAAAAARQLRVQGREVWEARAELVRLRARYAAGVRSAALLHDAERLAARLDELGVEAALRAHLVAGQLALERGQHEVADGHLERVARARRNRPPLARSLAWHARALQAASHGDSRATLDACRRGLAALDEHRERLGATELRAHASSHGAELAQLGQRELLQRGDARGLLLWSERWRANALSPRPASRHRDPQLVADLAAMRSLRRVLDGGHTGEAPEGAAGLEKELRRLESAVQSRTRRRVGAGPGSSARLELDELRAELSDATLVDLVAVEGRLNVVTVDARRVRRHDVGPVPQREVGLAHFTLRRLAYGHARPSDAELLDRQGQLLEQALLGPAVRRLGDGPVVVVPPSRLQAVPWGMLPSLRERVVTVTPSVSTWLNARRQRPPAERSVALVVGPGLGSGGAEVPELVRRYPGATLLRDEHATAESVLKAIDGAWLAHVAAHGRFRADNPLFSSLDLADGPLTVHDFEQLHRAPHLVVLSSCDSAVAAPVGVDELLGLVSGLVPLGAAGILASVVPVNDEAVVPFMLALHDALLAGDPLPVALDVASHGAPDDVVARATAASFVALGA